MKQKSEFKEWFEAQFGQRPCGKPLHELKEEAENQMKVAENYMFVFKETQKWDQNLKAAHYAWVAREKILEERK